VVRTSFVLRPRQEHLKAGFAIGCISPSGLPPGRCSQCLYRHALIAGLLCFTENRSYAVISRAAWAVIAMTQCLTEQGRRLQPMRRDGSVAAARRIRYGGRSLDAARLNGISTSPDSSRVWLTYVGKLPGTGDAQGGVLQVPAF
jgi:hypothetical protein